jgi:hypothetical protein
LRVITISYLGATDLRVCFKRGTRLLNSRSRVPLLKQTLKAIDFIGSLPRTAVRVSYDTHRTRLHAKAYLIHRDTGLGSAYIGLANISHAALTDELE